MCVCVCVCVWCRGMWGVKAGKDFTYNYITHTYRYCIRRRQRGEEETSSGTEMRRFCGQILKHNSCDIVF